MPEHLQLSCVEIRAKGLRRIVRFITGATMASFGRFNNSDGRPIVPIVVGTRPEAIKLVPIILALRESDC
jgi:hypothetical protein